MLRRLYRKKYPSVIEAWPYDGTMECAKQIIQEMNEGPSVSAELRHGRCYLYINDGETQYQVHEGGGYVVRQGVTLSYLDEDELLPYYEQLEEKQP